MGVFFEIATGTNYSLLPSTQCATISPGTPSTARSASRARSSRFGSLTCGTSRKIGAVTTPLPVFDFDATARPLVVSRRGGSGQFFVTMHNGTVYGYRAGISIKSLFPGYADLRADFTDQLDRVIADNARMLLNALTPGMRVGRRRGSCRHVCPSGLQLHGSI